MKFSEYALDRDNAVAFMEEAVTFWDIPRRVCETKIIFHVLWNALMVKSQSIRTIIA